MSNSRSAQTFILLLLLAAGAAAQQEPAARRPLIVPLSGAGFVGFRLEATRAAAGHESAADLSEIQAALVPQALLDEGNTIHRVLVNRDGTLVFGYDLVIEPLVSERRFKVYARPLSPKFGPRLRARKGEARTPPSAPTPATLPRAAAAQTLDDGDAFALDLLVNPQTGVRVTDVVKVAFDRTRLWETSPRDFTLDRVEIAVQDFRLAINGALAEGGGHGRNCTGALVWFYAPGRGRFIFSLVPRAGYDFQKIGLIEDNLISFTFKGERYEWTSSTPVVGQGGTWYAWVLHDPGYTPELSSAEEIARQAPGSTEEEAKSSWLKDTLAGRRPRPPQPQAGYGVRPSRDTAPQAKPARVRVGAADRMENLLPKH